ncbi:MAG TPA: 30S ribosomal protein S2 [Candidatus Paceibacterota bacterium]
MEAKKEKNSELVEAMFKVGAHFGFGRSRRHPSVKSYLFGAKNRVEVFDLEKTSDLLIRAKEFITKIVSTGGTVLFVGGKNESRDIVKNTAEELGVPYVAGRWIGGTLTNFANIRKRIEKMEDLISKREKGELSKYTKKERLLIDREIENLKRFFLGLSRLKDYPHTLFIIDHKREHIAVAEARSRGIPVVSLCGSDSNIKEVDYPILANDTSLSSIKFFVGEIASAVRAGKATPKA